MPAVFISHSSRDREIAAEIKATVAKFGFEHVFLDFDPETGIGPGENWEKRLYRKSRAPRLRPGADARVGSIDLVPDRVRASPGVPGSPTCRARPSGCCAH